MMRTIRLTALPLVCLAVLAWGSWAYALQTASFDQDERQVFQTAQAKKPQRPGTRTPPKPERVEPEGDTGPIAVFSDVEVGWKNEQVQQILRHYGRGKVTISIEGSSPTGGQFSRNQSYYLFQDLFKYTITQKFQFVQYRHVSDGRDDVYAVAERHYKRNDDGKLYKDKIYVSLHREDNRWVITEIKSIR